MEDPGRACSGVDNLSRLPDELLSRILSLLCTEDAVRTSVLSTRWRYLYTSISNLDLEFNSEVLKNTDEQDCMNFVDIFLFHRQKCDFDKFKLKWKISQAIDPLRLENWIKVVLDHGIRELDLCIYNFGMNDLLLPSSLFTSKTLEVLKLSMWKSDDLRSNSDTRAYGLELPAKVCLPSLKSINLKDVCFPGNDSWSRLFSNCPILEDFFYKITESDCCLYVSSPSLKRLTVESRLSGSPDVFVDVPSLVYLELSFSEVKSFKLGNVQSLVEANIDYLILDVSALMRGIRKVQTLRICVMCLDFLKYVDPISVPMLHNMSHLTIYDCNYGLDRLPYLLEKCERLETLVLEDECVWGSDKWNNVEESRIRCLTSAVKTIKVYRFIADEDQFEMVKYFLKTARVLELIEIHLDSKCENPSKIANELQMVPKISKAFMDVIF